MSDQRAKHHLFSNLDNWYKNCVTMAINREKNCVK